MNRRPLRPEQGGAGVRVACSRTPAQVSDPRSAWQTAYERTWQRISAPILLPEPDMRGAAAVSIVVMNWVWANSSTSGNERLVLLALADACSRDDGTGCWPSAATIARKANISDCTVRRVIARLEAEGRLIVHRGGGGGGRAGSTNSYTVVTGPRSRPASSRGSSIAAPVCQWTHSIAPPLEITRVRLFGRSRSGTSRDRISSARAAVSYVRRHSVLSRTGASRRNSASICSRVSALVVSTGIFGRAHPAVGSVFSHPEARHHVTAERRAERCRA